MYHIFLVLFFAPLVTSKCRPKLNEVFTPFYPFWNKNGTPHDGYIGRYGGTDRQLLQAYLKDGPKDFFFEIVQECSKDEDEDASLDNFGIIVIETEHKNGRNPRPVLLQFIDLYGAEFKNGFFIIGQIDGVNVPMQHGILSKGIRHSDFSRYVDGIYSYGFTWNFAVLLIKKGNASTTTFLNQIDQKKIFVEDYSDFFIQNTVDALIIRENDFQEIQPKWIKEVMAKLSINPNPMDHFFRQSFNKCCKEWIKKVPTPGKMNKCSESSSCLQQSKIRIPPTKETTNSSSEEA
uniref:Uncharacterized protein n=1 Tax=Panagrolaimus sp. ES5 TaxID=591445 RepID=A0AC34FT62_9BILA